jgi:hypothetical protein
MSTFVVRAYISAHSRLTVRDEKGQATAEFATVIILAIALGMTVVALVTGKKFDGLLHALVGRALDVATSLIA